MQIISPQIIQDKKVLLRLDLDVPIAGGKVLEDFRLKAALPTLKLCLENALEVVVMGHIGRPEGKIVPELSVEPIYDWFDGNGFGRELENARLKILENLRFEPGEDGCGIDFAKKLASFGDFYVNEAFAAHHPAASTTVLPALLPHAAGLRFAKEVEELTRVKDNPLHPLVVIVGGIKIEDKLPALLKLEQTADCVLVGGKVSQELKNHPDLLNSKIYLAKLSADGLDLSEETINGWKKIIAGSKMVLWNGPLGRVEGLGDRGQEEMGTGKGSLDIAQAIIDSQAESIVGGGDTLAFLGKHNLLDKFSFVSTGGGAMLKFLAEGTLPTIKTLQ